MDAPTQSQAKLLPDNAYQKLEPGEEYRPIVAASDRMIDLLELLEQSRRQRSCLRP